MTTENNTTKSTKPAFIAYQVRNGKDEQSDGFWNRVGAAFPHADGKGYTVLLDAIPLDGKITLRVPSEKKE
jgi:hypothetical protein